MNCLLQEWEALAEQVDRLILALDPGRVSGYVLAGPQGDIRLTGEMGPVLGEGLTPLVTGLGDLPLSLRSLVMVFERPSERNPEAWVSVGYLWATAGREVEGDIEVVSVPASLARPHRRAAAAALRLAAVDHHGDHVRDAYAVLLAYLARCRKRLGERGAK